MLKSIGLDYFPVGVRKTTIDALVDHPGDVLLIRGKRDFQINVAHLWSFVNTKTFEPQYSQDKDVLWLPFQVRDMVHEKKQKTV